MRISAVVVVTAAVGALMLGVPSGEAGGYGPSAAPVLQAEPAYTVGGTNTIRWDPICSNCWSGDPVTSDDYINDEEYRVTVTDLTTGQSSALSVSKSTTSYTATGLVSGHGYRYSVRARSRECVTYFAGICQDFGSLASGPSSNEVVSTQDTQAPSGSIAVAGGAEFVRSRDVTIRVDASDPGGTAASGVGFVQLGTDANLPCTRRDPCATVFAAELAFTLAGGADGPRTVYARLFDNARSPGANPASPPLSPLGGLPSGNASGIVSDTIVLDTTGPAIVVTQSADPAKAGTPLNFDATGSSDAGSGLDTASATWDFGDGSTSPGLSPSHTYTSAGTYEATLRVRDEVGNESVLELEVEVTAAAAGPPSTTTGGSTPNDTSGTSTGTPGSGASTGSDTLAPAASGLVLQGVRLALQLSEPGKVRVKVIRLSPRPKKVLGQFTRPAKAGQNRLALPPKLARRLKEPGRYRIVVTPIDQAGNKGRVLAITVRVKA